MIYLFGDLNYRIVDIPNQQVRDLCSRKEWEKLKQHDELCTGFLRYGNIKPGDPEELQYQFYRDFTEGPINFAPTYKYDKRSQVYDTSKKQRVPAWCDRILWKKAGNEEQQI